MAFGLLLALLVVIGIAAAAIPSFEIWIERDGQWLGIVGAIAAFAAVASWIAALVACAGASGPTTGSRWWWLLGLIFFHVLAAVLYWVVDWLRGRQARASH